MEATETEAAVRDTQSPQRFPRGASIDPRKAGITRGYTMSALFVVGLIGTIMVIGAGASVRSGLSPAAGVALLMLGISLFVGAGFALAVMSGQLLNASRFTARGRRRAAQYSTSRCHVFREALDAICIGVGIYPPPLEVMDLQSPNAYILPGGRALAVTPSLLEQDLSDHEVEAVMAAMLARWILTPSRRVPVQRRGSAEADPVLPDEIKQMYELGAGEGAQHPGVLADTLAARITGNPRALIDAITRISWLVSINRATPVGVRGSRMMFIPPSLAGIQARVENLERLEKGERRPYHEVRDGKQSLIPEAWE